MRTQILKDFEDRFRRETFRDEEERALARVLTWVIIRKCSGHDIHNGANRGGCSEDRKTQPLRTKTIR